MLRKVVIALFVTMPLWADTGFDLPAVIVSTDDAHAVSKGVQKLILSTGTVLSISGSTAKISLSGNSTNYVQTNPTAQQTTAFNTSSGTVATQINTQQLKFIAKNSLLLHQDGTSLLSIPDVNSMYFGYNTNLINTGGVFNYAGGPTCMPYPGGGNFNSCVGPFGMSGNVITVAENNNSMGYAACGALRAGFYNSCMGGSSGNLLRDGNYNTFNGAYAGSAITDANGNTHSGFEAGKNQTSGDFVSSLGYQACQGTATVNANVSGSGLTCIGKQTGQDVPSATVINNSIAAGIGALYHASNKAQIGGQQGTGLEVTMLVSTISVNNHYNNAGKISPVVSSCGATPNGSVVGYDSAGTITVGGGVVTSCTLTFATAWTNTPTCVISDNSTTVPGDISSISNTAVTFGFSTSLGGGKIYFICMGADS